MSGRQSSTQIVEAHLRSCLPPGVPASYDRVISAKQIKSGRTATWEASLLMFDGKRATVEVFKAGEAFGVTMWGHRYTYMPGGPCGYEEDRWQRFPEDWPFSETANPAENSLAGSAGREGER